MHTFYHPDHARHDPARLHRPDTPNRNAYYAEVAQRGHLIRDAIEAAGLGPITPPGDFGAEPIGVIHDYKMLVVLQNAHDRMLLEEGIEPAIPETFSVGRLPTRDIQSIRGVLGQFCYDASSPLFKETWEAAYWSAQTALSAAALVLAGGEEVTYALCRPPGHHALTNMYGGFCYLNNAAIAANWMVQQGQRVAILDIDYHHGNGTQQIFYGRSDVLFCSIHADPFKAYPFYWGYADEFGIDAGQGFNLNIPLPRGTGEAEYMVALEEACQKIQLFVPDSLVISLGVDTAVNDPLGGFRLETESFTRLGTKMADLRLPTVVVQEGGYLLSSLGDDVVAFLKGFTESLTEDSTGVPGG